MGQGGGFWSERLLRQVEQAILELIEGEFTEAVN
jgi:hypothetical protein